MAVIREDVVSIGFDVENNPFQELTQGLNDIKAKLGILNNTEDSLAGIQKGAKLASQELDGLTNMPNAPPGLDETIKRTKEIGKEAQKAEVTFTGLVGEMKKVGKQKLTDGIDQLTSSLVKPVTGIHDLAAKGKDLASNIKKVGLPHTLNRGLGKATVGMGSLLTKGKGVAALGFQGAISGLKSLASHAGKASKVVGDVAGKGLKAVGKGAAIGITAATVALGVGAVAAFNYGAAYETSLAKVSTMVDTSVMSVQDLSSKVMSLSNQTGEGASGLNEAVYQALSAGANTADVVDLVGVAVKAARGGFTDTTTAVDGLTSTLNAYGMETKDAEKLANSFLITQNKGKTTFGELASNIGTVAPTANAAGVGINELLAGVASLTANGIGTSEAMTGIKAAMSNVIKPSAEASKVAQGLGLDFSTAALQSKGLAGFLDDVKTATGGNMDTMAQLFGSVEALNTVLTLTSDNGMSLMKDTMNEMATNTTALDTAYETMSDTAQVSVGKGLNSFKNLGIGIYQQSEGIVSELTGLFASSGSELYDAFTNGGFDGLVGQIGTTLSNILNTVVGYLPDLVEGGVSIIDSLIEGITSNQDSLVQSLTKGITSLSKGIIKAAPKLLTAGVGIIASLLKGIAAEMPQLVAVSLEGIQTLSQSLLMNVPLLVQSGISILNSLISGLLASAPLIVSSGVQLIQSLVLGLLNSVDLIINGAVNLILALATGILSNIPLIIEAAVQLVTGFVNGLVNNINLILSGAFMLVQGILTGIVGNLPEIIQGGVQIVVALAGGLVQAIPQLLTALPQLVGAIFTTLMSINWLKLGLGIITGIGNGLMQGIKGLFHKGKDAGREVGDGVAAGVNEGTDQLAFAADTTTAVATESLKPDTSLLSDYGMQMPAAIAIGIENGASSVQAATDGLSCNTVETMAGIVDGTQPVFSELSTSFDQTLTNMDTSATIQMGQMDTIVQTGFTKMVSDAGTFRSDVTGEIDQTNLYQSGVNMMQGLDNGMNSMRDTVMATARGIANDVKNTVNGTLDIHSPSRVLEDSGENSGLGLIKGLRNMTGKIMDTAQGIGNGAAYNLSPMKSRYSPEGSTSSSSTSNSQVNTWNPVFNLTLNGASASDSNERKVKRWVKDAIRDSWESMGRTNPRLQEV